jgi:hypothetical protein
LPRTRNLEGSLLISGKLLSSRMSEPDASLASAAIVTKCDLDLREEARQFFRQRIRVAGTGMALGGAFVVIGALEAGTHISSGFAPQYLIAILLVVLGLAVLGVSLYSSLLNPVTRIQGNAAGLSFERRWGRPIAWRWKDPQFRLDIDDRTNDPVGPAESRQHLFFEGPNPIYGNLTPSTLAPLLDVARTHGAPVSFKQLEQRERSGIHLVRRVRVRPAKGS